VKIHILGSAAGGGFPQWNCNCSNCDGLRKGSLRGQARTQSSIAISSGANDGNDHWTLCNTSPDLLQQLRNFPEIQPARSLRDTAIRSIVLLDSQIDHTTGLLMLRESTQPLRIYCTEPVYEDLTTGNPLFKVLSHYCKVDWQAIRFQNDQCNFVIPGSENLKWTAYPLSSKAPPYSPHRNDAHVGDNIGLVIEDSLTKRKLFYSPGLGKIDDQTLQIMNDSDCVLVDGTFWRDDEMIRLGVSKKYGRDLGHLPQSEKGGMIEVLNSMKKPRKILIHINNTNPILNEASDERKELVRHGIEVAFDGMEIIL